MLMMWEQQGMADLALVALVVVGACEQRTTMRFGRL
jgi:hypothetical protein